MIAMTKTLRHRSGTAFFIYLRVNSVRTKEVANYKCTSAHT